MPLTETTIIKSETGDVLETNERKLYTLAELKDGKHIEDEPSDIIESRVAGAYQSALEWLAQGASEMWDGRDDEDWLSGIFAAAGITFNFNSATWNVGWGGTWFALPKGTDIDVPVFLRAMKDYYAGIDFRHDSISPESYIICPPYSQHKIDLRSRDARIVKEQGLVVQVNNSSYGRQETYEFDIDYHYEDVSDQFKEDANSFLQELCHVVARSMDEDYESVTEEENLLDMAEANEYTFTKTGRRA